MLSVATVEWAGSVAGVLAPVVSLIVLAGLKVIFSKNKQIEKGLSEVEGEIIGEIRNGVTDRLNELTKGQAEIQERLTKVEDKLK